MIIAVLSSHTPSLYWFRIDMMKAFRVVKDVEGNITPEILPSADLPDGIKPTMTFDTSMPDSLSIG